jgi:hypothetical protein
MPMPASNDGLASASLGSAKETGLQIIADGQFENLWEARRAGLRRFVEDARIKDRLVILGEEGLASGIDAAFDIDTFVEETREGR